jgi:hypothetical protein
MNGSIRSLVNASVPASELLAPVIAHQGQEAERTLGDDIRRQTASYFPEDYTIFVRVDLLSGGDHARITYWIATPRMRWSSGLLARRTWGLLLPILQKIAIASFAERLDGMSLVPDQSKTSIRSYAPRRLLTEPIVLAVAIAMLTAALLRWGNSLYSGW